MKIGILTSSNDMITLFSFLQRYDHEYHIRYDDTFSFRGDKTLEVVMDRVQQGIQYLEGKGVDTILVPPMLELKSINERLFPKTTILPLFTNYLQELCFQYSLVGKLGFFGDWLDIQEGQKQISILAKNYTLSDNQRNTKKFHFPFAYRGKEVRNRKYLLDSCSWSMPLVHHMIKQDLRYFKDAGVDTLIPCNYSYFSAQKAIEKSRYSKMKFYGIKYLEEIFKKLTEQKQSTYSIHVYHTGHGAFLLQKKKYLRTIGRGKNNEIQSTKI